MSEADEDHVMQPTEPQDASVFRGIQLAHMLPSFANVVMDEDSSILDNLGHNDLAPMHPMPSSVHESVSTTIPPHSTTGYDTPASLFMTPVNKIEPPPLIADVVEDYEDSANFYGLDFVALVRFQMVKHRQYWPLLVRELQKKEAKWLNLYYEFNTAAREWRRDLRRERRSGLQRSIDPIYVARPEIPIDLCTFDVHHVVVADLFEQHAFPRSFLP